MWRVTRTMRTMIAIGALVASLIGCTRPGDLEENSAEVSFDDRNAELKVTSCGLDGEVFVLVASASDLFLQLLVVVRGDDDEREVDIERSGVSLEVAREGVLGAGDADLLQTSSTAVGTIESARIRGDRIDLVAEVRVLPSPVGDGLDDTRLEVAARCSEADELAFNRNRVISGLTATA